jgi:DNA-directed RNA polymerase omega subunit
MKLTKDETAGLCSDKAVTMMNNNRYNLVLAGARRARELTRGDMPKIALDSKHSPIVTALLEIEAGKIGEDYVYRETQVQPRPRSRRSQ